MAELKHNYTAQEIEELRQWFEAHRSEIPTTMDLGAIVYNNLPKAIEGLFAIADQHHANPTFSGQVRWLYVIKEELEKLKG